MSTPNLADSGLQNTLGRPSWQIATASVAASVTEMGGMLAPVTFTLADGRTVAPYYVAPWHSEVTDCEPPVLGPLRGDFFCLPFGADNRVDDEQHGSGDRHATGATPGEDHLPHGEAAWSRWQLTALNHAGPAATTVAGAAADARRPGGVTAELRATIPYQAVSGRVEKRLLFDEHYPVIYSEHRVQGFVGSYPLGYHAVLKGEVAAPWLLFVKPFDFGMVDPAQDAPTHDGEYYSLAGGAEFMSLDHVPTRWKNPHEASIRRFPALDRVGFVDIVTLYRRGTATTPSDSRFEDRVAWVFAVNSAEKYLWFSIKDRERLPATTLWMENRGRHHAPWSGRNCCIGVEETCTYFAAGRRLSIAPNRVNARGVATAAELGPDMLNSYRTIQGVVDLNDDQVAGLIRLGAAGEEPQVRVVEQPTGNGSFATLDVRFGSAGTSQGPAIRLPVDLGFLKT